MRFNTVSLALSASLVTATNLWIADYGGAVTTVNLREDAGRYSLKDTSSTNACGPAPSWLTIDTNRGLMFCLNEGLIDGVSLSNGSVASFTINPDASLSPVKNETTILGPVNGLIYGNATGKRGLAVAQYLGSAVTTFNLLGMGRLDAHQTFTYTGNGPEPEQDAPHPHEAIMDPTGQYILVPDLGLDKVHIYTWDRDTLKLTEIDGLEVDKGTGPRHAVFWTPSGVVCESCATYMYLVGELAGDVTSYKVGYKQSGMTFRNISSQLTQADNPRNAPAEVEITPDGRFLLVSNRDVAVKPAKSTRSSLSSFVLYEDGTLDEPQVTKSKLLGPGFPRHFSMNKYGNLLAVGLQHTNSVIILQRNTSSGEIMKEAVAKIKVGGQVTNAMWDQ